MTNPYQNANNENLAQNSDASTRPLERIKRVTAHGRDYWSARELMPMLGYSTWRSFLDAINRAKESCDKVGETVGHHFADTSKMIDLGKGAKREVEDLFVSRYACYLIAQNGDPTKPEIAAAQAYVAIQTRRQELADEAADTQHRISARERVRDSFRALSGAAQDAGVTNKMFGVFHDAGLKALYGGLGQRELRRKKGLPDKDALADYMGPTELAMNDFRQTQAKERLQREGIKGQAAAIRIHAEVGDAVRRVVKDHGNTLPEDLTPHPHIKTLKRNAAKSLPESTG